MDYSNHLIESIYDNVKHRITNPFLFSFVVSYFVIHFDAFLYLVLSEDGHQERIRTFYQILHIGGANTFWDTFYSSFFWPLFWALFYSVAWPFINIQIRRVQAYAEVKYIEKTKDEPLYGHAKVQLQNEKKEWQDKAGALEVDLNERLQEIQKQRTTMKNQHVRLYEVKNLAMKILDIGSDLLSERGKLGHELETMCGFALENSGGNYQKAFQNILNHLPSYQSRENDISRKLASIEESANRIVHVIENDESYEKTAPLAVDIRSVQQKNENENTGKKK